MKHNTFLHNECASASVEFILIFPILVVMCFAGIELTRTIVAQQRLVKATYAITDVVTQYTAATDANAANELTQARLDSEVFPLIARMMNAENEPSIVGVSVTSLQRANDETLVRWKRARLGSSLGAAKSKVTNTTPANSSTSDLCDQFIAQAPYHAMLAGFPNGENIIIGEVFYQYNPLIASILGVNLTSQEVRSHVLFMRPRAGELLTLPPIVAVNAAGC